MWWIRHVFPDSGLVGREWFGKLRRGVRGGERDFISWGESDAFLKFDVNGI